MCDTDGLLILLMGKKKFFILQFFFYTLTAWDKKGNIGTTKRQEMEKISVNVKKAKGGVERSGLGGA